MYTTDYNNIACIKPIYPELMSSEAEYIVSELFNTIKHKKEELAELRVKANCLSTELDTLISKFEKMKELFEIEYKVNKVEEIKEDCMLLINNKDDARNL